jgi:hypothetical protein
VLLPTPGRASNQGCERPECLYSCLSLHTLGLRRVPPRQGYRDEPALWIQGARTFCAQHGRNDRSNASLSDSLFDTEGHARRAYDAKDGMLVLVRTDVYVGFIANDDSRSGVEAYLDTCLHRDSPSTN